MAGRIVRILIAAAAIALSPPRVVEAHARLVRADPAPGAAVTGAPRTVHLWFNEELAAKGSTVTVVDARGRRVDDGTGRLDFVARGTFRFTVR
jgi:copper transport protein